MTHCMYASFLEMDSLPNLLNRYATTQLVLMGHAQGLNYERSEVIAKIRNDHTKDKDEAKFRFDPTTKRYMAGVESSLVRGGMSADEYRRFMGAQGMAFVKTEVK